MHWLDLVNGILVFALVVGICAWFEEYHDKKKD